MSRSLRLSGAALVLVSALASAAVPASGQESLQFAVTGVPPGFRPVGAALMEPHPPPQQSPGKNRAKGALWGGGIGLVSGGLLAALTIRSDEGGAVGDFVEDALTPAAVVAGALGGAAIGALLGATIFAPSRDASGASSLVLAPGRSTVRAGVRLRVR